MNRSTILKTASNSDVYARGEQLFYANKVINLYKNNKSGQMIIDAHVESNHRLFTVRINFNRSGELHSYSCSCEEHSIWRGACKHVVATLMSLIEDAARPSVRPDTSSKLINELVSVMSDSDGVAKQDLNGTKLSLGCTLHMSAYNNDIKLSFTIGHKRKYIVKSIDDLYRALIEKTELTFGKYLSFTPNYSLFDAESLKLFKFMIREHETCVHIMSSNNLTYDYRYLISKSNERYINLSKQSLDTFFDIHNGKYVESEVDSNSKSLYLTDKKPDYKFSIEQIIDKRDNSKAYQLSGSIFSATSYIGEAYNYILVGETLHRVPQDYHAMLKSMLKVLTQSRNNLVFSGSNLEKFISIVYPSMKKNEMIGTEKGDFSDLQNYEFTTKLYLHSDSDAVYCKAIFDYNGNEVTPLVKSDYIYRDVPEENRVIRDIVANGFTPEAKTGMYVMRGDDNIYEFLRNGIDELNTAFPEVYVADSLKNKVIRPVSKSGFRINITGDLLSLTSDLSEYNVKELVEALESYETHMRYHKLKSGKFISFDDENIVHASDFLSSLDLSKKNIKNDKILIPKYKSLYLDALSKKYSVDSVADDDYKAIAEDFVNPANLDFDIPEPMTNVLREYQKTGFKWLKMLAFYGFGGILADDMGLGKTIQIIAMLSSLTESGKQSIVVCPASVLYNWEKEIKRFSPGIKTLLITGTPDIRKKLISTDENIDVVLTTYDLLKRDIEEYSDTKFEYVIADEAQNIKNPSTQNAQSLKSLNGRVKFALTGTPIENNLTELWSIFDFIMPGYLNNHSQFSKKYESPIIKDNNTDKSEKLKMQIAPFIMRRLKRDVLTELPEKTETTLYAEMYPEQRKLYAANLMKARGDLDNIISKGNFSKNSLQILASLTRLRQICCHPSLFVENYIHGSGKLDLTIETVNIALESGHRILLFSQFTSMLGILKTEFERNNISFFYLDGSTNLELRMRMVEKFNSGERKVFLVSLKAGGTGLNLTGADVVIHYDQWWNPAVMEQASDRAHRYGQEKAVQIFNIVAKDSIEERILELQMRKKGLIDQIIVEGGNFINKMSEQEVLALFDN